MGSLVTFDGIKLHFEEEGGGSPVVLLHGLSSSTQGNWIDPGIWSKLVASGRRVIGLDARGHGQSDKPHDPAAYAHDAMVRDTWALIDLLELERTDLVGYSMGAATALQYALSDGATSRLNRLVLGGIGGDPAKWGARDDARSAMPKRWLAGLEAEEGDTIDDPVARGAQKLFAARGNDLKAMAALLRSDRKHLSADFPVGEVAVPTLVVCGDKDADPRPLASAIAQGEADVLEGDHESVVGNPMLAESIVAFLNRTN